MAGLIFRLLTIAGIGSAVAWFPQVAGLLSSLFIYISGFFLGVAGLLFNEVLKFTVVDFNGSIFQYVAPGINIVWTGFRDLSNILIIGMFTFIAICMILGVQSFGQKKMVAHVLIIAVLINFSLFFTRIIIEGSNLIAKQFYTAALAQTDQGPSTAPPAATPRQYCYTQGYITGPTTQRCFSTIEECNAATRAPGTPGGDCNASDNTSNAIVDYASKKGISGQFIQLTGLTSAFNAQETMSKMAAELNSSPLVLLFGLFVSLLVMATALVLFYGTFLLVVRTILFLILLVSSSLAFAAFLIPKFGEKYWSMWWQSLLRNAVFGPLLMLLLWTSLTLGKALVEGRGGSFDQLFSKPGDGNGILALFFFLIIIGMLFASIRIASLFASQIAGFNFASMLTALPFAAAARYGIAPILRQTSGRGAYSRAENLDGEIAEARKKRVEAQARGESKWQVARYSRKIDSLIQQKRSADTLSKRSFDVMNTGMGKSIGEAVKLPKALTGQTKTNFGETAEKQAKEAAKLAVQGVAKHEEARDAVGEIRKGERETLDRAREEAATLVRDARSSADNLRREEQAKRAEQTAAEGRMASLKEQQRHSPTDERAAQISAEDAKIRSARTAVNELQGRKKDAGRELGDASRVLRQAQNDLTQFHRSVNEQAGKIVKQDVESAQKMVSSYTKRGLSGILSTVLEGPNDGVTRRARGIVQKQVGTRRLAEREEVREARRDAAGLGPSTPPTPPTPPATP